MLVKPWQQAALLAAITFAVFSATLTADFVYDARMQILAGDFIHDWRNWPAVLSFSVLGMDVLDFNRPVMLASLMLDAAAWGREPFGYHLTSVLIHVVNVVLLWLVIREMTRPETGSQAGPEKRLLPLLTALIFAVHPIVAEAVVSSGVAEADIAAIGATYGPGLIGSLLVGVSAAKAMAMV